MKWILTKVEAELRETNKQKQGAITSLRTEVNKHSLWCAFLFYRVYLEKQKVLIF